jgi:phosphatidylinositol N-acetylglucosaminyltransferase subunit P
MKKAEHSPAPDPTRAIYGFFLSVSAIILFVLYIILAYLPDEWLIKIGWNYLPQKYWFIALPAYVVVIVITILFGYITLNMRFINDPSSLNTIQDKYSNFHIRNMNHKPESLPPIHDIPISEICELMYLD